MSEADCDAVTGPASLQTQSSIRSSGIWNLLASTAYARWTAYVEREAAKAGINCKKEGNCFSRISDAEAFAAVAETLTADSVIGRLTAVCDRYRPNSVKLTRLPRR